MNKNPFLPFRCCRRPAVVPTGENYTSISTGLTAGNQTDSAALVLIS